MMDIFETALAYAGEARKFFQSPRKFITQFDSQVPGQVMTSIAYTVFAFVLTSAFVLVELRLIPKEITGSESNAVKKDELIFSYWVLILLFVFFIHVGCRLVSGIATFRTTFVGILRIYSFLVPATTLVLIICSQLIGFAVSTSWLVTPPLGVLGFEPFVPTTGNLMLIAAFMTVYFYLGLFFLLCTVWMLRNTHQLLFGRAFAATALGTAALLLVQPFVIHVVRKIYEIFEPLVAPFVGT